MSVIGNDVSYVSYLSGVYAVPIDWVPPDLFSSPHPHGNTAISKESWFPACV